MKKQAFLYAALIAAVGIVLLFVLIPKIWGILLILLALAFAYAAYSQFKHPDKAGDIVDKVVLLNDRFHRARKQNGK